MARLERLIMPVLVMVGARDVLLDSRGTARRIKMAQVRLLPDEGHLILGQTEAVLEFLRC